MCGLLPVLGIGSAGGFRLQGAGSSRADSILSLARVLRVCGPSLYPRVPSTSSGSHSF